MTSKTNSNNPSFYIVEGQVWHMGAITSPGQYGDYYLPLNIGKELDLVKQLQAQRDMLLAELQLVEPDIRIADNASWNLQEDGGVVLKLKWKPADVSATRTVVVDTDNQMVRHSNQELTDARLKVSFLLCPWQYEGRCGTKLKPRKIQLQELGTLADTFDGPRESDTSSDF